MGKIILKLHQPHKWDKSKYISDDEYYELEKLIYNDKPLNKYYKKHEDKYDDSWLQQVLKEDEVFKYIENHDNYVLTTYGRVFNIKTMRQVKPSLCVNSFTINLRECAVNFKKEFINNGWIYSPSFIKEQYNKHGWKITGEK